MLIVFEEIKLILKIMLIFKTRMFSEKSHRALISWNHILYINSGKVRAKSLEVLKYLQVKKE